MDGAIARGRYTSVDGSFNVRLPHATSSFEGQNLQVRDGKSSGDRGKATYVIFGPGPTDPAGYHVILATARRDGPPAASLAERAARINEYYMRQYNSTFGGVAERLVFERTDAAGRPAIYSIYRYEYGERDDPEEFFVAFKVIQADDGRVVNVMAEKLTTANPWYPGIDTLVGGTWDRFNDFAASVEVID